MAKTKILKAVEQIRELVESLGPPIKFRKLNGIVAALEIQVEDGKFQKHAVARLCEAILATAELYTIDEDRESTLEELACSVIDLVER